METAGGGGGVWSLKNILVMKVKIISKQKPGAEGLPAERKGMGERTGSGRRAEGGGGRTSDGHMHSQSACAHGHLYLYRSIYIVINELT